MENGKPGVNLRDLWGLRERVREIGEFDEMREVVRGLNWILEVG